MTKENIEFPTPEFFENLRNIVTNRIEKETTDNGRRIIYLLAFLTSTLTEVLSLTVDEESRYKLYAEIEKMVLSKKMENKKC